MSIPPDPPGAIDETPPDDLSVEKLTERSLHQRIRQQEILSEIGVAALHGTPFAELLDLAARLTAEGMNAEFCKILEHIPAENRLLVRAGVGWHEGVVGHATVGGDLASPPGFALRTGKPVISNHLENEVRFRTSDLLVEHGIHRAMNVILQGDGKPFGVLEVDSRLEGKFSIKDIAFLQGMANVLGMAIERQRYERNLKAALDHHQTLLKEINHRAKNSLQLVASMLQMQAREIDDPHASQHLTHAATRVSAVGRLYERLTYGASTEIIEFGVYLRSVCDELEKSGAPCTLDIQTIGDVEISPDRAINVALIVNELVTNSSKYAYPDQPGGPVWVCLRHEAGTISLSIRDKGVGLPDGFDIATRKGLGMRIVSTLCRQLGASLKVQATNPGTEFVLLVPVEPSTQA